VGATHTVVIQPAEQRMEKELSPRAPWTPPTDARTLDLAGVDAVVVLPTLNEEEGLARTFETIPLKDLERAGHSVRVVVIDGGSTDRTLSVAGELGIPVLHQTSRGKGSAVTEALHWVSDRGVRFALVMDADCTYPAEMIGPVIDLLKAGSELVVGVRTPILSKPIGPRDIVHRVGNTLLNWLALQSTGQHILDLCRGFYGVDLATGIQDSVVATGFEVESELFIKSYRAGLTVTQIPIIYRERVGIAKLHAVHDGIRIFFSILRSRRVRAETSIQAPSNPGPLVRDILAACFVHGSRELIVMSHSSRTLEAEALLRNLRGSRFEPRLISTDLKMDEPHAGVLAGVPNATAVLHLGERDPAEPPDSSTATVYLTNTRRVVRLDLARPLVIEPPSDPQSVHWANAFGRSAAYRAPGRTGRIAGSVSSLGSILDSSGRRKELVLLGANGLHPTVLGAVSAPPEALNNLPTAHRGDTEKIVSP